MIPERLSSVLSEDVVALAASFEAAGHPLYLVGGSVRDALLGRDSDDLDFTTSATPDEIERIAEGWASSTFIAGREFGTIGLVRGHDVPVRGVPRRFPKAAGDVLEEPVGGSVASRLHRQRNGHPRADGGFRSARDGRPPRRAR